MIEEGYLHRDINIENVLRLKHVQGENSEQGELNEDSLDNEYRRSIAAMIAVMKEQNTQRNHSAS